MHVSTNKVCAKQTRAQLQYSLLAACQVRAAVTVVLWTPEGRRLLTGSQIGEFTLWNGAPPSANLCVAAVLTRGSQARRSTSRPFCRRTTPPSVRSCGATMKTGSSLVRRAAAARAQPLLTAVYAGDDGGVVKYWQPNMNNVKATQAHKEPVSSFADALSCTSSHRRHRFGGWRFHAQTSSSAPAPTTQR